jgi:hypothetical protein
VESELLPKLRGLRDIIAAFIGAAPDDPVVGRTILTVVALALILAISHRSMLTNIIPGLVDPSEEIDPLIHRPFRAVHLRRSRSCRIAASLRGVDFKEASPVAPTHQTAIMTPTGACGRLRFQGHHDRDRRHRDEA